MNLSKNFSLKEMLATSTGVVNIPTDQEIEKMKLLAEKILQPVRDYMGIPIRINSGFRSAQVNAAVGGSKTSQHCKGEAADLNAGNRTLNKKMYEFIRDNLEYDQLINEYDYTWVHVSYTVCKPNRKQQLVIK